MKDIPGFEDRYAITTNGRVWSKPRSTNHRNSTGTTGRWLKPIDRGWALLVNLSIGPRRYLARRIHRLVLETYIGPAPEGCECRHLNGDYKDNRLENLAWGTSKENKADTLRHGNAGRKLTVAEVRRIKDLLGTRTHKSIAQEFGVDRTMIGHIATGRAWSRVNA